MILRRTSRSGALLVVAAVGALFAPIAAASNATRAIQTATLLGLLGALLGVTVAWLVLRPRGYVRAGWLALAAATGTLAMVPLLASIHDVDSVALAPVRVRLVVVALSYGAGVWLMVMGLRRIFPRPARGLAFAAVAFAAISLFPAPMLLLQPVVAELNILDVHAQLHAGFLYWTVGSALLVAPFLAVLTLPGDWFERWWSTASQRVMGVPARHFVIVLVIETFVLTTFFAWFSFDARPTTADEIAQLWHARILLTGRLALPPDANPEFFGIDNIIDRPAWMSQFPIGGPAVFALGVLVHASWLVNPVLTALTSWNVYRFCRRAYGEAQARVAAIIVSLSPLILLMGGTHMNHMPTAWLVTLALAALPVWVAAPDARAVQRSAALIGVALGLATTIRPLDGVVAGSVFGLVMLRHALRDRMRARSLLVGLATGAVPIALLLIANWRTTGSPTRFGYELLWGANHSLGLHDDPTGHAHTAWRALLLGVKYAAQLNWVATAWPVPVALIVCVGLLFARRAISWDVLLLAMLGAQIVAYAFYWHDGQFIGPRFVFTAVPALLILAARAPFLAAARVPRGSVRWRIAIAVIPVCLAVAWLRRMPPFGVQGLAREFRESRSRLKLDPPREIQSGRVQNALVFVQEGAATRLLHRMWGLGVSRPDASRLLATADACSLLDAVLGEESLAQADSAGRAARISSRVVPFHASSSTVRVPDPNFRITSAASMSPACTAEVAFDARVRNTVAYGPFLLLNELGPDGRVGGSAVYVMNLHDRNEVLRKRFADRHWFRYEVPLKGRDTLPVLIPYDSMP